MSGAFPSELSPESRAIMHAKLVRDGRSVAAADKFLDDMLEEARAREAEPGVSGEVPEGLET